MEIAFLIFLAGGIGPSLIGMVLDVTCEGMKEPTSKGLRTLRHLFEQTPREIQAKWITRALKFDSRFGRPISLKRISASFLSCYLILLFAAELGRVFSPSEQSMIDAAKGAAFILIFIAPLFAVAWPVSIAFIRLGMQLNRFGFALSTALLILTIKLLSWSVMIVGGWLFMLILAHASHVGYTLEQLRALTFLSWTLALFYADIGLWLVLLPCVIALTLILGSLFIAYTTQAFLKTLRFVGLKWQSDERIFNKIGSSLGPVCVLILIVFWLAGKAVPLNEYWNNWVERHCAIVFRPLMAGSKDPYFPAYLQFIARLSEEYEAATAFDPGEIVRRNYFALLELLSVKQEENSKLSSTSDGKHFGLLYPADIDFPTSESEGAHIKLVSLKDNKLIKDNIMYNHESSLFTASILPGEYLFSAEPIDEAAQHFWPALGAFVDLDGVGVAHLKLDPEEFLFEQKIKIKYPAQDATVSEPNPEIVWDPVKGAIGYIISWVRMDDTAETPSVGTPLFSKQSQVDWPSKLVPASKYTIVVTSFGARAKRNGHSEAITFYSVGGAEHFGESALKTLPKGGMYVGISIAPPLLGDEGIRVLHVEFGSPAMDAGIQDGDILINYKGVNLEGEHSRRFVESVEKSDPGVPEVLEYRRDEVSLTTMISPRQRN